MCTLTWTRIGLSFTWAPPTTCQEPCITFDLNLSFFFFLKVSVAQSFFCNTALPYLVTVQEQLLFNTAIFKEIQNPHLLLLICYISSSTTLMEDRTCTLLNATTDPKGNHHIWDLYISQVTNGNVRATLHYVLSSSRMFCRDWMRTQLLSNQPRIHFTQDLLS